jgi:hypothetical protein
MHSLEFEYKTASEEEKARYKEHILEFKCHIPGCTNVSAGPKYINTPPTDADLEGLDPYSSYDGIWEADWDIPTRLFKCEVCQQWTCPHHMRPRDICVSCFKPADINPDPKIPDLGRQPRR